MFILACMHVYAIFQMKNLFEEAADKQLCDLNVSESMNSSKTRVQSGI